MAISAGGPKATVTAGDVMPTKYTSDIPPLSRVRLWAGLNWIGRESAAVFWPSRLRILRVQKGSEP